MSSPLPQQPRWVYALLAAITAYGIYIRAQLPIAPFSDRDTWGFLFPSLNHLTTGVFCHVQGREFPYPLFIDRVLALFGTLNALSVLQHLLGVLTAFLLWEAWQGALRFFPATPALRHSHRWIGLALSASYLLSLGPLKMEHTIRPEAVFPLVAALALLCGTRFGITFFLEQKLRPAFFWGAGLVAAAFSLLFIKGAFGVGALAAIAPVLAACFRRGTPWRFRVAVLAVPLALVLSCLWYPERQLVRRYDTLGNAFAQQHLFAFQGRVIRKAIEDEIQGRQPAAYERDLLQNVARRMDDVLNTKSPHYGQLGFDADAILYAPDSAARYLTERFPDGRDLSRFYMHYYWAAWRYYPLQMLHKVTHQLYTFYWMKSPYDIRKDPLAIGYEAVHGTERMPSLAQPLPLFDQYIEKEHQLTHSKQTWRQPLWLLGLNRLLALVYRLCSIGALAAAVALFWKRGTPEHRRPLWWFLYLMGYGFFNTLTLAVGHTLEVRRYVQIQLSYTLLATGCGLLLLHLLIERKRAAKTARVSQSQLQPQ